MNGNPKNRNVAPPKQINRIAAPIQVAPNNTPNQAPVNNGVNPNPQVMQVNTGVQNPQVVRPQVPASSVAQAAQNQSIRGNNTKKKTFVKKEHDPSTMIFITILLIILAGLCAFIFYVILPRVEASKNKTEFNDVTSTTIEPLRNVPTINSITINNGNAISTSGSYPIDAEFNLTTTTTGSGIDVSINNIKVTTTKRILGKVGRVDELVLLILADGDVRSNRLVVYDKSGQLIKEIKSFAGVDGMLLMNEVSGYIFSKNNIILISSRINDNKIVLSSELGSTDGIEICNTEQLTSSNIDDNFMVMGNYSITYKGNNEFTDPVNINNVTLQEYRDSNKLCR